MANVIKAVYGGGRFATTAPMFQWNYGDKLQFVGIQLPANYEVHFANALTGTSVTALGNENGVEIPASVFQPGSEIYAWVFLTEEGAGWTKYQARIPIYKRAQPTNETPTPAQQSALDSAIALLNEAAEDLSEAEQGIPTAIDTALQEAKDSGEFDGRDGTAIWYTKRMFRSYIPGDEPYYQYTTMVSYLVGSDALTPTIGDYVFGPETGNGEPETPNALFVIDSFPSSSFARLTYICNIKGETGPAGQDGQDGTDGTDGYSPTVTVEEITGGHRVTITDADGDHVFDVMDGTGGGGGTSDYDALDNRPQINSHTLTGNQSAADLGLGTYSKPSGGIPSSDMASAVQTSLGKADSAYQKPSGGIPKTDLASAVQTSLGKADTALQSAPVTSVNGQTGDVSLSIPSTAGDVGAIPAPASPSSGDVLTYSSGAWAAAAPAHQIPAGGNAGECLAKNSSSDYDLRWRTINDWTPAGLMRTAGGTAAKVAEWSFWSATQFPAWLVVTVGNSNTYAGAITLKVNGNGPYPVYINGTASSATNYSLPAGSYFVCFDGSKFDFRTDGKLPGDIIGHADKDIQAPASPTTGDFLCWNGSAWAATSLSAWQGGNY